jgi:hypothetical protein
MTGAFRYGWDEMDTTTVTGRLASYGSGGSSMDTPASALDLINGASTLVVEVFAMFR